MNLGKNLTVTPYDDSLWDQHSMYDQIPYTWDTDLNDEHNFSVVSGNVIKACRCLVTETYELRHEG